MALSLDTVTEDNPPSLEVPNPVSNPEELSSQIAETNDMCIPSQADLANSESQPCCSDPSVRVLVSQGDLISEEPAVAVES